jgi:hypothetical protein
VTSRARPTIDLDGEWRFVADPERLYRPTDLPRGEPIRVPGCWEAQVSRPYRIITAWYRRSFHVPAEWRDYRVLIRFGAVMYRCSVWLNGKHIGEHEGGYTPFYLQAQDAVRWGEENDLAVEVVNPLNAIADYPALPVERVLLAEELVPDLPLSQAPHGKQTWYSSMSGIWQSVRVERAPNVYLGTVRVMPDPAAERAFVRWSLEGGERRDGPADQPPASDRFRLEFRVRDPDGAEMSAESIPVPSGERGGQTVVSVPEPKLWDIGQPNLYRLDVTLVRSGKPIDLVRTRFGMRRIETRDGQILLNGRPIYLLGALDQDFYPKTISTPPSRQFLEQQFRAAREMGLNLLRCHIKIPDPAYLDAADEAGILLWCELPNWTNFTINAARRGRATLEQTVEAIGNHPSLVIWTIVNEDWGTSLRYEARDRNWLRQTVEWLKELDPTRLVVDNSPCETPTTPNFHVRTDLADFHVYFGMPDNAVRWRNAIADFARRPAWLWSPHGDAEIKGDEPLVLSEFGNWGLPRLDRLLAYYGGGPWWFDTGHAYYRPSGIRRRFATYGLDRIWPDVDAMAEATQWHQYEALHYEIGQMRRHGSIQGYVITEFSDAYWEANGLLDVARGRKAFHDRLPDLNASDVVVTDLERRDVWGGDRLSTEVSVSSYGPRPREQGGVVTWWLIVDDGQEVRGEIGFDEWPRYTAHAVGRLDVDVPTVDVPTDARLLLAAYDGDGHERARDELRLAIMPAAARRARRPIATAVHDPLSIWKLSERLRDLGHEIRGRHESQLLVATELTQDVLSYANAGGRVIVLVRTRDAVPEELDLAHRVTVHLRRLPHAGFPGQRSPWEGDWVSNFNWILPQAFPSLPVRAPLDFAYTEVLPDHVLLGYDPEKHRDEVAAGMFVGWVHTPAAIVWTFRQGKGAVTLTTFRVAPESGPVATALLQELLSIAAGRSPATPPELAPSVRLS